MKEETKARKAKEAVEDVAKVNEVLSRFVKPLEVPKQVGSRDVEVVLQSHFETARAIILFEKGDVFAMFDDEPGRRWTATHTPTIQGPVAGYTAEDGGCGMVGLVAGLEELGAITKREAEAWIEWFRPQLAKYQRREDERELHQLAERLGRNVVTVEDPTEE